ncbi:hypothetical protein M513_11348 [Trichuris suis]|uniref:Uncharacterized protein n=1 Tax=Trichuris suis TaxID=68888 RepID=A0A085LS52_9BILA|nr:hypothetical protein M513_11348 [Trichuris suis]
MHRIPLVRSSCAPNRTRRTELPRGLLPAIKKGPGQKPVLSLITLLAADSTHCRRLCRYTLYHVHPIKETLYMSTNVTSNRDSG